MKERKETENFETDIEYWDNGAFFRKFLKKQKNYLMIFNNRETKKAMKVVNLNDCLVSLNG